jgi:hypothetical protein
MLEACIAKQKGNSGPAENGTMLPVSL